MLKRFCFFDADYETVLKKYNFCRNVHSKQPWYSRKFGNINFNKRFSQMWAPLAAHHEPVGVQNRQPSVPFILKHKTQCILIRAPHTRTMVFWHINNIPQGFHRVKLVIIPSLVASLMSLMASLVTTSRMQQCFNVLIDICREFLLLFYCYVLLEIKLTTSTTTRYVAAIIVKYC